MKECAKTVQIKQLFKAILNCNYEHCKLNNKIVTSHGGRRGQTELVSSR